MQITLTAAGSPAEIQGSLNRDVARESAADGDAGIVLRAVRDYVSRATGAGRTLEGDEAPSNYTVSAEVKITVTRQASAEDAERARKALVGGLPFTSTRAESTTGQSPAAGLAAIGAAAEASGDASAIRRRASDAERARIDAANTGTTK